MLETVIWQDINGVKHTTVLCQYKIPFAEIPGIYIFCKKISGTQWAAVYVGECENFNDRLNLNLTNHHRLEAMAKHSPTHVCVMRVDGGKTARLAIETALRRALNPPCNLQ